ncbi:DUF2442 domain-containing protein [Gluconobacter sp. AC10]|uniref:DUF2442 domain-containing protein n=1 Tax=Gluconobacter aidae TaxID=2662454 RepID=A0A7X1SSF3_9PROT|nr:DUF2442 domain-containing protein [Gluconobacter aidae]
MVSLDLLQDLQGASLNDLAKIEITPLGKGLHWPRLDADVLVEGLIYGSRSWMAAQMGRVGGSSASPAKAAAARQNGTKSGRPRNVA